jgi:hypothetical protein
MKLDEWEFKKYAPKRVTRSPHEEPRRPSPGNGAERQPNPSSPEHSLQHPAESFDTVIRLPLPEPTQFSVNPQVTAGLERMVKTMAHISDKIPCLGEDEVKILEQEFEKDPDPILQTMLRFSQAMGVDFATVNVST